MLKQSAKSLLVAGLLLWRGNSLSGAPAPLESLPKDAVPVPAAAFSFDRDTEGKPPKGFEIPVSGSATPDRWEVQAMRDAPSKPYVLMHPAKSDAGTQTTILLHQSEPRTSGEIAVRFKTLSTDDDQTAGLAFRYVDAENYWLLALNSKEDAGTLYQVKKGKRKAVDSKETIIAPYHWHEIKLAFTENTFTATLDQELLLGGKTKRVEVPGRAGVFTAPHATVAFDDYRISR